VLTLSGDWIAQSGMIPAFPAHALQNIAAGESLAIDMTDVGHWDSGIIAFLWDARIATVAAGLRNDTTALPESARTLLGLLPDARPKPAPKTMLKTGPKTIPKGGPLGWLGGTTLGAVEELGVLSLLAAAAAHGSLLALRGRAQIRRIDLLANIRDAGPSALVIVSVVNFLIGAILAFVGAAQLRKFAAGLYVANLVGLALVREMAAVMTAIVMAGRTGGAYAARIATMQGSEEIYALRVTGISVDDYLVLPSILALVFTLPFLYLYGCLVGVLGGLVVATAMLDMSAASYLHQTLGAVPIDQFVFGFGKSIAFAILIGVTSCRIGLKAGRSSADVGAAATQAVVAGIVGVIAMDAVFAVIADRIGI
jgi:phospholipid/cholesterol/gamma-HCH transport system permease protein